MLFDISNMDARYWAESFVNKVKEKPEIATDEGTMNAWFATSIMCGWDNAQRDCKKKLINVLAKKYGSDKCETYACLYNVIDKIEKEITEIYPNSDKETV